MITNILNRLPLMSHEVNQKIMAKHYTASQKAIADDIVYLEANTRGNAEYKLELYPHFALRKFTWFKVKNPIIHMWRISRRTWLLTLTWHPSYSINALPHLHKFSYTDNFSPHWRGDRHHSPSLYFCLMGQIWTRSRSSFQFLMFCFAPVPRKSIYRRLIS